MEERGMNVIAVRNAAYNENGGITCEVQFDDALNENGGAVWLPYNATPIDRSTHGKALWEGLTAGIYGQVPEFTVTNELIEAAKNAKINEINRWRDAQENMEYLMEFNGRKWDYGKKTLARINATRQMAEKNMLPTGFAWTDGDNNIVPVTAAELLALGNAIDLALFKKGVEINTRQLQMKAEIRALNSLEEIRSYSVGWL